MLHTPLDLANDRSNKFTMLIDALIFAPTGETRWIDMCPTNANLVAGGGNGIQIFDRRTKKVVKNIQIEASCSNIPTFIHLIYFQKAIAFDGTLKGTCQEVLVPIRRQN